LTEESIAVTRELSDVKVTRLPCNAVFECELSRSNVPVTWYKDDQPLRRSQRLNLDVEGRVHRLTLKNVDSADDALYSVVAKNVRSAARLSVQCQYHCMYYSLVLERCNPFPHVANRHVSISQLLSN